MMNLLIHEFKACEADLSQIKRNIETLQRDRETTLQKIVDIKYLIQCLKNKENEHKEQQNEL